ncbi:MAG: hypothetical protein HZA88_19425 [Verrucomicrobia bacterium]|nr:hypothetical protein [Verrucomicrobiota bacterium]
MLNAERPHLEIAKDIAAAKPEQRKQLVAAILRIVEPALRAPQPWSDADFRRIGVSASALAAASDDNAILTAFGSTLSQVGFLLEPDVILALSACRDSKAAEALADLARLRLKQVKEMTPRLGSLTDEEKRKFNDTVNSFFYGLKGLAKRANEPDKAVARELGAEFAKLFDGSPYQKEALRGLAETFDPLLRGAVQPAEDVVSYTREVILMTEEGPITKEIRDADPDRRKKLLAAVVHITDGAFKTPEPKSDAVWNLIVTCAHILEAVADDDATVAAFASRLDEVYDASRPAVIRALARCRDPRAVDALAEYARARLKEISSQPLEFPLTWTQEQKQAAGEENIYFLFALSGLAHSANPSGKAVARELRDKYVKLYDGSHLRDGALRALMEFQIDPLLQDASKIWITVAAGIGGVIVLGILIWFLRRK